MRISDWSSDVCSSDLLPASGEDFSAPLRPRIDRRHMPQRVALADAPEAELRRHALRCVIAKVDDAAHVARFEVRIGPAERRGPRLGRTARPPMVGVERPPRLGPSFHSGEAAPELTDPPPADQRAPN